MKANYHEKFIFGYIIANDKREQTATLDLPKHGELQAAQILVWFIT